jgi:ParB/RepB/Spo0J family partition protein
MPELISIDLVKVHPKRQRHVDDDALAHIQDLATSIRENGLLNPPVIDDENYIVAGFCRWSAMKLLGWAEIPFNRMRGLTLTQKKTLELEENVRRKQLTYVEEAEAISELHALKQQEDPSWTQEKTAEFVGKKKSTISNSIQLAEAIKTDPSIKQAETLVGALQRLERKKEIDRRTKEVARRTAGTIPMLSARMMLGDAAELIKGIPNETFDAIVTNPPFGVELDLGAGANSVYYDEEDYISDLVRGLCPEWYRTLKPNSWLVSFFDVRKITYSNYVAKLVKAANDLATFVEYGVGDQYGTPQLAKKAIDLITEIRWSAIRSMGLAGWLEQAGFEVNVLPCVWVKPNKTQGVIRDPSRHMVVAYEALLFARKGPAPILKQGHQNIFIYDTVTGQRDHPLEMNVDLCKELVSMVAVSGSLIHDSFAGSASIGLGALEHRCNFLGFELDSEKCNMGTLRLKEKLLSLQPELVLT